MPTEAETKKHLQNEFDSTGYVMIPGFLSAEELQELSAHLDRFIREIIPTLPPDQVYYDDKSRPDTLKQIQPPQQNLWVN